VEIIEPYFLEPELYGDGTLLFAVSGV
jgi:hypothetical protein